MTLEGGAPQAEGAEKPTEQKVEPTVEETKEFRAALDKALGKGLESTNRQLSLAKAETDKAKAEANQFKAESEARQARISALSKEVEEALVDDPEKRQVYLSRIASLEREEKLAKREAEAEGKIFEAEKSVWAARMGQKAVAVNKETGIDITELEGCQTEEEMEVKGLRFQLTEEPNKVEGTPKFASGVSSGSGGGELTAEMVAKMSPEERFARSEEIAKIPLRYTPLPR